MRWQYTSSFDTLRHTIVPCATAVEDSCAIVADPKSKQYDLVKRQDKGEMLAKLALLGDRQAFIKEWNEIPEGESPQILAKAFWFVNSFKLFHMLQMCIISYSLPADISYKIGKSGFALYKHKDRTKSKGLYWFCCICEMRLQNMHKSWHIVTFIPRAKRIH